MKKVFIVVLCAALFAGVLTGCGASGAFKDAVEILEERGTSTYSDTDVDITYYEIASDESYIKIDTNPYDIEDFYAEEASQLVADVNAALGFSESLYEKMNTTRALDGRQTDENDNFTVSWSYHPDNGLAVLYEKK